MAMGGQSESVRSYDRARMMPMTKIGGMTAEKPCSRANTAAETSSPAVRPQEWARPG